MAVVNPYLNFKGTCEEAFNFYKSVFGGEFKVLMRMKDMDCGQPVPDHAKEKIMHVSLPISKETILMASDSMDGFGPPLVVGNNISISIAPDSEDDARRIFNGLSAGGKVMMPLDKVFWGALFGMFVDKFGIQWMVNYEYEKK